MISGFQLGSKMGLGFLYFCFLGLTIWSIRYVSADSCCDSESCGDSCPWKGSCNNGFDYSCMDGISGMFKCRDKNACKNYYECTGEEAALRSGQLCNRFPWYNGGYPFDKIKTENEVKTYNCTKSSANGFYCDKWDSMENSFDEFELGKSECLTESDNGRYCQEWTALGLEYKKCWFETYDYQDEYGNWLTATHQVCCDDSNKMLECCQKVCPVSFYTNSQIQYEKGHCWCKKQSKNGDYCQQWYCEERTVYDSNAIDSDKPIEYEWYSCAKSTPLSFSYCPNWDGDIDSVEEFEVATCTCDEESADGSYCKQWYCLEKGFDYWWPNLLWNLLSCLLGGLPLLALLFIKCESLEQSIAVGIFYFIWASGFIMIGIWKAGVGVLIVSGIVLYIGPLIIFSIISSKNKEISYERPNFELAQPVPLNHQSTEPVQFAQPVLSNYQSEQVRYNRLEITEGQILSL